MGYNYMGYVISLDELRALHGSRDEAVLARLTAPRQDYVGYLMGREPEAHEKMAKALEAILNGEDCGALPPHHYGYAVVAWCREVGQDVFELDTRDGMRASETLETSGLNISLDLWSFVDADWPIPIPPTPDYPLVGCFDTAACARHAQSLKAALDALEEDSEGKKFLASMHSGFARAVEAKRDLIVFNY